jgi:hypothetical protein
MLEIKPSIDPQSNCHWMCLTPMRNESWIVKEFLAAARLWASQIVVADQGSTDGTLQQLQSAPDVSVVINDSPVFDEPHRQRLLINRARHFDGKRILLALDADEAVSSNCIDDPEWKRLSEAEPGTAIRLPWVNILPGFEKAWIPAEPLLCGLVDDGTEHTGRPIHNPRVPWRPGAPVIDLKETVVLHFQYLLPERTRSKQRWYQVWEHLNSPDKSPLQIFRQYNHMRGSWEESEIRPIDPNWMSGFDRAKIDFRNLTSESVTWWDKDILEMLSKHGVERFRKLAIWDKDWSALCNGSQNSTSTIRDPRSLWEKAAHRTLFATQNRRSHVGVRAFEKLLRVTGW